MVGGGDEGVRKGAVQILLSSSSITTNKSPLTRHNGIKPTKGREGVDKRLSAVDTLIPFVVQKRVRRGTSIAQRKQLLQQITLFTTRANTLKPLPPFIQPLEIERQTGSELGRIALWDRLWVVSLFFSPRGDWKREAGEAAVLVSRDSRFHRSKLKRACTSLTKSEGHYDFFH